MLFYRQWGNSWTVFPFNTSCERRWMFFVSDSNSWFWKVYSKELQNNWSCWTWRAKYLLTTGNKGVCCEWFSTHLRPVNQILISIRQIKTRSDFDLYFAVWQSFLVDKLIVQSNLKNKQTYVFSIKCNYWYSLVSILSLY